MIKKSLYRAAGAESGSITSYGTCGRPAVGPAVISLVVMPTAPYAWAEKFLLSPSGRCVVLCPLSYAAKGCTDNQDHTALQYS